MNITVRDIINQLLGQHPDEPVFLDDESAEYADYKGDYISLSYLIGEIEDHKATK